MNTFSAQDYPSDQTKGRSCSSCGDGWLWQVTIFVIDCFDVSDEDDGDGDGDDGGHGDCVGNLYDSDHEKKNTNTNMTCSISLLPRLRPELARF